MKTDYRFVRGHMCPKDTAERISRDAAYNTHILVNAVPQLQWQNNGVWKDIEKLSTDWANRVKTISFLIPNIVPKEKKNLTEFITTIDKIEGFTGLDFLTVLGTDQAEIEKIKGSLDEWEGI